MVGEPTNSRILLYIKANFNRMLFMVSDNLFGPIMPNTSGNGIKVNVTEWEKNMIALESYVMKVCGKTVFLLNKTTIN
jgi:hypothetical protein